MTKKSSTLLDQNLGPSVDCTRGRGLAYHCPRQRRELGGFGQVLGKRPNGQTSAGDKMQALVLTSRGRNKYFYRWMCLEDPPIHNLLWQLQEEEKHAKC